MRSSQKLKLASVSGRQYTVYPFITSYKVKPFLAKSKFFMKILPFNELLFYKRISLNFSPYIVTSQYNPHYQLFLRNPGERLQ